MSQRSVLWAQLLGTAVIAGLGFSAALPSDHLPIDTATRFKFGQRPLEYATGDTSRQTRAVHQSLRHIQPWIASVGAAAAVGDIDGNLKADDICFVDTRTDQVIIAPLLHGAPQTSDSPHSDFEPFALPQPQGDWDPQTVAPMGCLIGDLNEDGVSDLVVYYWGRPPALYLGDGAAGPPGARLSAKSFSVHALGGIERWFTNAALLADVDGDGHVDLVVGNYFCDGGRILDAKTDQPVCPHPVMQDSMSRAFNGGLNRVLLFNPAKRNANGLPEVVEVMPFAPDVAAGWTLGIGAQDLLADGGAPDLYFANDFGPDRLLANCSRAIDRFGTSEEKQSLLALAKSDENGRLALEVQARKRLGCFPLEGRASFKVLEGERTWDKPRSRVLGQDSFKGMGVEFGDVDGDGIPDIYVSNITEKWALQESQNLYLSQGRKFTAAFMQTGTAPYSDESEKLGLSRSGWAWDAKLADFDNDGKLEALQAVGFVRGRHAGPGAPWRKSCWAMLQELATANDLLLKYPRSWFDMEHGDSGVGCDLSGDSRRNPFFVLPAQKNVFERLTRYKDTPGALSTSQIGRYADAAGLLKHLENRVAPTRGLAIGDADQDGWLDYVEAKQFAAPEFHRNEAPHGANKFIGFTPRFIVGKADLDVDKFMPVKAAAAIRSRPAIGAQIVVELTERASGKTVTLRSQVDGGNGHSGKRSPDIHFGLGDVAPETPVKITVAWQSAGGKVTREFRKTMSDFKSHVALLLAPEENSK